MNLEEQEVKKGLLVNITYGVKKVGFNIVDPTKTIKQIIDGLIVAARNNPDTMWDLPEINNAGQRIIYYLGRMVDGKEEIFKNKDRRTGDQEHLRDYKVKEGDNLVLLKRVYAG